MLVLLNSQSPSLVPLINFLFCLTAQLTLFFSALSLLSGPKTLEGRSTATGWAPLTSRPPGVPSLGPCRETETSSRMGCSTCLAGLTCAHQPTFHPSVTRSEWNPIPSDPLSPRFQVLVLQEGGPLPGPKTGLLSNTRKWIVWGDTCADKARDFIGKGHPGGEQ